MNSGPLAWKECGDAPAWPAVAKASATGSPMYFGVASAVDLWPATQLYAVFRVGGIDVFPFTVGVLGASFVFHVQVAQILEKNGGLERLDARTL